MRQECLLFLVASGLLVLGGCSSENDAPANDDGGSGEDAALFEDAGAGVDSGPADSGVACKKSGGSCKMNRDCCSADCHSGHCH